MAKLTAQEILNEVLRNCGEATVSALTSLTGIQLLAWNKITEALQDITTDQNTHWSFLESVGIVPLTTGNNAYTITALTTGSDMQQEDIESFRSADADKKINYISPQQFDLENPKGITSAKTGYPDNYTKFAGQIVFDRQATATQNGKNINFRYWKHPTYFSTSTSTGTCDIPEPFDRTLLVALATLKVLTYLGSSEAIVYKLQVFGDASMEGSLGKMKEMYSSPKMQKLRMTYQF